MALINCPECNREVSDKAEVCPNCGFRVAKYVERQEKIVKIREETEKEAYLYVKQKKKEAEEKVEREKREEEDRKSSIYNEAVSKYASKSSKDVEKAEQLFLTISGWRDSDIYLIKCKDRISELIQQELVQQEKYNRRKKKIIFSVVATGICVGLLFGGYSLYKMVIVPQNVYKSAMRSLQDGDYEEAIEKLETIIDYKDTIQQIEIASDRIYERNYNNAKEFIVGQRYSEALEILKNIENKDDVSELITLCENALKYQEAVELVEIEKYREAISILEDIEGFKDSTNILAEYRAEADYIDAVNYINSGDYENAVLLFENLGDYKDAKEKNNELCYQLGINAFENKNYEDAKRYLEKVDDGKDIADILSECELQVSCENLYLAVDTSMKAGRLYDALDYLKQLPSDYKDVGDKIELYNKYKNVLGKWKCVGYEHYYGYNWSYHRWIVDEDSCKIYNFIVNIDDSANLYLDNYAFNYNDLEYTGTVLSWSAANTTFKLDLSTGNMICSDHDGTYASYTHAVQ